MKNKNGFTLIEAIVVAVIMAVLAGIAIPLYNGYIADAKIDAGKSTCELIASAIIHTNNRGILISNSSGNGFDDIGITDPSDENWTYSFNTIAINGTIDNTYTITAQSQGTLGDGYFKPKASGSNRWSGSFAN